MANWWWDKPEFVDAQQDPGFQAWVQAVELGLDLEGINDLIPDMPPNMFAEGALSIAERTLLERYPDKDALYADNHNMFRFAGYLGQYFVHNIQAHWVCQPKVEKYSWSETTPALEFPWKHISLLPMLPIIRVATIRRSGDEWDFLYRNNKKKYLAWKAGDVPDA